MPIVFWPLSTLLLCFLKVCEGDRIIVDVINRLENGEGISIHWHGLYQKNTPYMDGISMLTQCPILPHTTFRYNFTANNSGTHWWHGHTGFHRADGLFGALIVRQSDQVITHGTRTRFKVYLYPKNMFWYMKGTPFGSQLHQHSVKNIHQVMK